MKIPLVDLKAQYDSLKNEIDDAIRSVIKNAQFILGQEVETFESELATYCQTKYAVSVASGTEALQLALLACDIKPGDEVITTPFTFIATAIYYPLSLHLQQAYKRLSYKPSNFPESKKDQEEVLSLPIYPELGYYKIEEIVKTIESHDK